MELVSFLPEMSRLPMEPPGPVHHILQMAGSRGKGAVLPCFCGIPGANLFLNGFIAI